MLFATNNIINAANIEQVLNEVTRSIVTKDVENNILESHTNLRRKKPSGRLSTGETPFLNMSPQDTPVDSLPLSNNYWLAQRDPDYVHQEEKNEAILKLRKKNSTSEQGVHTYLDSWREGVYPKRTLQEHFPNSQMEGTKEGSHPSMGSLENTFANLGIGYADAGLFPTAASRKMSRKKKVHWPKECI